MEMHGKPNAVINRFGNVYRSDAKGTIVAKSPIESELFKAYGFEPVVKIVEKAVEKAVEETAEEVPVTEPVGKSPKSK